ncbi:bactofilin [Bacillus methanolicus]|uniref:polymer-forming cytoskeletal protein n=1 Tax=Bacillus methanolicus TaxID=1471 RepID=UPI00238087D5|nr:polymer-forming cytoskeletal protein [Bacillus methanolicus]MDE3840657.1 bactofilin [Bacillus methanolicus]
MENDLLRHLTVTGTSITSGGNFNKVKIRGDGTINGDLHCVQLKVFGNADVNGIVKAKSVDIFGQANMRGNLEADTVKIFGEADIHGHVTLKDLSLRGGIHINGNLVGGNIHGYGEMKIENDCEADSISIKGAFTIKNTLNAEKIELFLHFADSRIAEIGGENIHVAKSKSFSALNFLKRFSPDSAMLLAECIEGDVIYLEYTKAKVVRGNEVIIGPGCEIDLVEYQTSFQQDEKAKVTESKKV